MRILSKEEISEIYPVVYRMVFGTEPDNQIPRTVIVHESNEKIDGFISGYLIDNETFYMAWGGTISTFSGIRNFWKEGEKTFKDNGINWFRTVMENTNTVGQRMLMGMGWIPHGMRMVNGKIFVEYYKEL